jgi:hypothetical protein
MITHGNLGRTANGYVGIDPGTEGAIAVSYGGRIAKVYDMPMHAVLVGGKTRSVVDFLKLSEILTEYLEQNYRFIVEMTPVFITKDGGSSSSANWSLGYSQGFMTAFFLVKSASFMFVRAQEWHKPFGYKTIDYSSVEDFPKQQHKTSERRRLMKNYSMELAKKLAPHVELVKPGKIFSTGRTTKDKIYDGRCEAIIIAEYGRRTNGSR